MEKLRKQTLIDNYKKAKELYALRTGGSVIGQEVDENNRLVYVVKRKDGTVDVSYAENEAVVERIIETKPTIKRIVIPLNEIIQKALQKEPKQS